MRVVIAAVAILRHRHAAKLRPPDDECAVEQASCLEIGQQPGYGLIGLFAKLAVVLLQVLVGIPIESGAAAVDLNEPNTLFDQPAGDAAAG